MGQRIELALTRLADLAVDGSEVVAVDGGRSRRDRARRPLRVIAAVPRHPVLRRDARPRHLQQVELRRDLEHRPLEFGVGVHGPRLPGDAPDGAALPSGNLDASAQFGQCRQRQVADPVALAVDRRDQLVVPSTRSRLRVRSYPSSRNPVRFANQSCGMASMVARASDTLDTVRFTGRYRRGSPR